MMIDHLWETTLIMKRDHLDDERPPLRDHLIMKRDHLDGDRPPWWWETT